MIVPDYLIPGSSVGVVASAKRVNKEDTIKGIDILKSWELDVMPGKNLFMSYHQFAGTDQQRKDDLQEMINNPDIKAIFMARGGYGTTRIIDDIDFKPLVQHPKWICGFSDITALHLHLNNLGICSFHSPMPSFFHSQDQKSLSWFKDALFGKNNKLFIHPHRLNKQGKVSGKIIGGNLSIICHTIGTKSEIEYVGNLLFIEDVGEKLYHLDRMMVQLKRTGILGQIAGLIVGQFTEMEDSEDPYGMDSQEIIHSHIIDYNYPVTFDFPIGHTHENYALPVGMKLNLEITQTGSVLNIGD